MNLFENLQLMKESNNVQQFKYVGPIYVSKLNTKKKIGNVENPIFTIAKSKGDANSKFINGLIATNNLNNIDGTIQIDERKIMVTESISKKLNNKFSIVFESDEFPINTSSSFVKHVIDFTFDFEELQNMYGNEDEIDIIIKDINDSELYDSLNGFEQWYNDYDPEDQIKIHQIDLDINDFNFKGKLTMVLQDELKDINDFKDMVIQFIEQCSFIVKFDAYGTKDVESWRDTFDGPVCDIFSKKVSEIDVTEKISVKVLDAEIS